MKVALTQDEKQTYIDVARQEFVRIGLEWGFVATPKEALAPNPDAAFIFECKDEEDSVRFGSERFNAEVFNVTTNSKAYLRFGFGVNVNVPLQSEWFEEDKLGKPTGLKKTPNGISKTELLFLQVVFGAILPQTDPAGLASLNKYMSRRSTTRKAS
jgi:hypothetical protein